MTEFALGGLAACGAGVFTNPLEVVKTRMQLQGELKARGLYSIHYKNFFHAFYAIASSDGIRSLQRGLTAATFYQLTMNGIRLGTFQTFINQGLTKDHNGNISFGRSVVAGAVAGCVGAFIGSPMYLVKTHMQVQSTSVIAVGHQHGHEGFFQAFSTIYKQHGILGLWRGVGAAIPRVTVGSSTQLATFTKAKYFVDSLNIFPPNSWYSALTSSILSGGAVAVFMSPFDVISTRLYNQGVDVHGRGLYYSGFLDCCMKMIHTEGFFGFYKGWTACLFRVGPHTILSLVLWDELRKLYAKFQDRQLLRTV